MLENNKLEEFDLLAINVDELEFTCVDKKFDHEIEHPETGELLRESFHRSGLRLESQFGGIFIQEFSQGGGYEYYERKTSGIKNAEAFSVYTAFVLFLGEVRIPFSVVDKNHFSEDGKTRIWEVLEIGERSVVCKSPLDNVPGALKPGQSNIVIAHPFLFDSPEKLKKIIEIIKTAFSGFNYKRSGRISRRDGKEMSLQEENEKIDLKRVNRDLYNSIYVKETWLEKIGKTEVIFPVEYKANTQ